MKEPLLYKLLRPLDKIFMLLYRPKKIGLENIPRNEAYILAGNHTAKLDPLLIMMCNNRCISYLGKIELFKGWKKYFFDSLGVIPVDRSKKHNSKALEMAINHLKNNGVIGIFPEGTINRTTDVIMPFKYGAVKMAKETDAWVVPFAITGKYRLFRRGLVVRFGNPYKVSDTIENENKILEDKVIKLIEENNNGGA